MWLIHLANLRVMYECQGTLVRRGGVLGVEVVVVVVGVGSALLLVVEVVRATYDCRKVSLRCSSFSSSSIIIIPLLLLLAPPLSPSPTYLTPLLLLLLFPLPLLAPSEWTNKWSLVVEMTKRCSGLRHFANEAVKGGAALRRARARSGLVGSSHPPPPPPPSPC